MRANQVFLFFAISAVLVLFAVADRTYSIKSSQVPNLQYEVDAIECLQEAYVLYPENTDNKRNDAFSKLFQNRHSDKKGWNIAEGCVSSYNPSSTVFIEVLVEDNDAGTQSTVKIYD